MTHKVFGRQAITTYKLSDYTDEIAGEQAKSGATVKYFTDLAKKIVSEEFLNLN